LNNSSSFLSIAFCVSVQKRADLFCVLAEVRSANRFNVNSMFTVTVSVLNTTLELALSSPQISFQFYDLFPILKISRLHRLIVHRCAPLIPSFLLQEYHKNGPGNIFCFSMDYRTKYGNLLWTYWLHALRWHFDCLTLEDGTDRLSRNVVKEIPFNAA
jgi:hypothetical protein